MAAGQKAAPVRPTVKGRLTIQAPSKAKGAVQSRGARPRLLTSRASARANDDETESDDVMSVGTDEEGDSAEERDTDEEIAAANQAGKSKKTAKRKRRATSPSSFGATLQGLLGQDQDEESNDEQEDQAGPSHKASKPSTVSGTPAILSLAPHIRRGAQSSRLNEKAARLALAAKRKREDRARVVDVIGGWGAPGELPKTLEGEEKIDSEVQTQAGSEASAAKPRHLEWLEQGGVQGYEKRLRKAAQRGVVKLFNAIRAAQNTTEADLEEDEEKETASALADVKGNGRMPQGHGGSIKKADNPLGGKAKAVKELSKNNFFDLLRAGTQSR